MDESTKHFFRLWDVSTRTCGGFTGVYFETPTSQSPKRANTVEEAVARGADFVYRQHRNGSFETLWMALDAEEDE